MILKTPKFKFILLFSCLFVFFFLISIQTTKAACPSDGCYCWCKNPSIPEGENACELHRADDAGSVFILQADCNDYCVSRGWTAIHFEETYHDYSATKECVGGAGIVTPPTAPAEKPPTAVTREAPTCVVTPECSARFLEAKKGILSNISEKCYCCGDCGLNDIVNIFIGAANYLFGIVGALALLFFIYGGILWLTAGGKSEQIEKGKKVLIGAVVGLAIVFGAWLIVQFVLQALGVQSTFLQQFLKTR
jgi:hypothetical protein